MQCVKQEFSKLDLQLPLCMDVIIGRWPDIWSGFGSQLLPQFDEFFLDIFCKKFFGFNWLIYFRFCSIYLLSRRSKFIGKKIIKSKKQSPTKSRPNVLSFGVIKWIFEIAETDHQQRSPIFVAQKLASSFQSAFLNENARRTYLLHFR